MKLLGLIAIIGSVSAINMNSLKKESPQEVGVPNTPGPLYAMQNYTTKPFQAPLGNKTAHQPWPAAPTDALNYTGRYGIGDRVSKFNYTASADTEEVADGNKWQE